MPLICQPLRAEALSKEIRRDTELGAEVSLPSSMSLLQVAALSERHKSELRRGLFTHGILVIREQLGIEPRELVRLAQLFDDTALDIHSGGEQQVTDKANILALNNCSRIPRAPQVTVIGQGSTARHQGLGDVELKHLDHTSFHEHPLSLDQIDAGLTRPYRWHMDAPLYERLPGVATVLHAIAVPDLADQKLDFQDAGELPIAAGATAFFSGAKNFQMLDESQQAFALNTTVRYAPRAYEWIKDCKATADGLTIASNNLEKREEDLPLYDPAKVHAFPMVWRNPSTDEPHLQIAGCCVRSLETKDPLTGCVTINDDLTDVRRICRDLQRKAYTPQTVYAHR